MCVDTVVFLWIGAGGLIVYSLTTVRITTPLYYQEFPLLRLLLTQQQPHALFWRPDIEDSPFYDVEWPVHYLLRNTKLRSGLRHSLQPLLLLLLSFPMLPFLLPPHEVASWAEKRRVDRDPGEEHAQIQPNARVKIEKDLM